MSTDNDTPTSEAGASDYEPHPNEAGDRSDLGSADARASGSDGSTLSIHLSIDKFIQTVLQEGYSDDILMQSLNEALDPRNTQVVKVTNDSPFFKEPGLLIQLDKKVESLELRLKAENDEGGQQGLFEHLKLAEKLQQQARAVWYGKVTFEVKSMSDALLFLKRMEFNGKFDSILRLRVYRPRPKTTKRGTTSESKLSLADLAKRDLEAAKEDYNLLATFAPPGCELLFKVHQLGVNNSLEGTYMEASQL